MFQRIAVRAMLLSVVATGGCLTPDEPADTAAPAETAEQAAPVTLPPGLNFRLPFVGGSVWRGVTRQGHNGGQPGGFFSIDWTNAQGSSNGQTLLPSAPGTVIPVIPDPNGYGNFVDVSHGSGWTTRYAHLSAVFVRPGDFVDANRALGLTGSTGSSTGPHLHYEQRFNGVIQPAVFENQAFNYAGQTLTSQNFPIQSDGCTAGETAAAAQFGCACVDHNPSGGFCPGTGCTAGETAAAAAFGCACVDHNPSGGFCPGTGCTAAETAAAAAFGCACVDHNPSGGFCPGTGCTAAETAAAATFGCACVDHNPSGGFCPGTGCTAAETAAANAVGCECVDHRPSGGFCPGTGCTAAETAAAAQFGCGCRNHRPSGGFCPEV
jgi:Peptidase family M23